MPKLSQRNRYILVYVVCLLASSYFFPPHVRSELYKQLAMHAVVILILGIHYYYQRRELKKNVEDAIRRRYKDVLEARLKPKIEAIKEETRRKIRDQGKNLSSLAKPKKPKAKDSASR